ncbi:MAG: hypothetical protein U9Q76_06605, partial [candidate division WOR-3 bacterium]|nr:hypothetical protein [candidate division WOR-3 bacterium]
YRWHLMAKTKRLMMIAEQQKRELASEAWVQVPRVDRDYERSRESARTGGGAKEVIETQGGIPSINLEGRGKEDYDLFNRWLIGNWNYTIDRSLIDTGAGFMGLGETFPDWRPDDMTFELKEAGAIWYVWEAMQYSANMWSRALEIAYEYAMSQKTISRDSRREMKELYANSIPNDPLDALKKILSNMPSSRKQSQYLLPPTPEYGTTSEEGMDAVSNEIISRFYGDIDREIFQRIPKVPNIASLLSELIFTGDYSPTYKYGKRAESKTQTFSESEQEESVMEGDVPGVTVHGSRPRPTFNYSLRTGFTTQQEGIGLDFAYVELPEVSLDWESFFDDTQFQQIQEAIDRIEAQERAERLSEILHPEPEPSPLFNLQNSLNQQDYRQDLKLFNGVYLQPSSTGNFGLDIVVEVERGNLIPLDENYLDAMLCGIFAEYSNQ